MYNMIRKTSIAVLFFFAMALSVISVAFKAEVISAEQQIYAILLPSGQEQYYEITVDGEKRERAAAGERVSISVAPASEYGYGLVSDSIKMNGEILRGNNGLYSFIMPEEDASVTAEFTLAQYTIRFECNNGSTISDRTFYINSEDIILPVICRAGYEFLGWYADPECEGERVEVLESGSVGNRVYYAKWQVIPITGAMIEASAYQATYGESILLRASAEHILELSYEWYFNGEPLHDAEESELRLTECKESGRYKCRISAGDQYVFTEEVEIAIDKKYIEVIPPIYSGELYYGDELPTLENANRYGDIAFKDGQSLAVGRNAYEWIFIPYDDENYIYDILEGVIWLEARKGIIDTSGVIFDDVTYIYDGYSHTAIAENLPGGIVVEYTGGGITEVGTQAITAIFSASDNNYEPSLPGKTAVVSITPRVIRVIPDGGQSKIYDGRKPQGIAYSTDESLIIGNAFSGSLGIESADSGRYRINIGSLSAGKNYIISLDEEYYTVTPREITVRINDERSVYGDKLKSDFTYGLISGNIINGDNIALAITKEQGLDYRAEGYLLSGIAANPNYSVTVENGRYYIDKRQVTVEFGGIDGLIANGEEHSVTVKVNGAINGDDVKVRVSYSGAVIGAGKYTATVSIDNENYILAGQNSVEFEVLPAPEPQNYWWLWLIFGIVATALLLMSVPSVKRRLAPVRENRKGGGKDALCDVVSFSSDYAADRITNNYNRLLNAAGENSGYAIEKRKRAIACLMRPEITAIEANKMLSDNFARSCVCEVRGVKGYGLRKEVVNVDTLSEYYCAGELVDIISLREKGLVSDKCGRVKILGRGTINKPLTVHAHYFSKEAIKMILLTGGNVYKLK